MIKKRALHSTRGAAHILAFNVTSLEHLQKHGTTRPGSCTVKFARVLYLKCTVYM